MFPGERLKLAINCILDFTRKISLIENMALFRKNIGDRFVIMLTEYQGSMYTHIRDLRKGSSGKARHITLTGDIVKEMSSVWPDLLEAIEKKEENDEKLLSEEDAIVMAALRGDENNSTSFKRQHSTDTEDSFTPAGGKNKKCKNASKKL